MERIKALRAEIIRREADMKTKKGSISAADAAFKI